MLVDWDTVAMARPERDLWMLVEVDDRVARTYQQLTGVSLDPELLAAYRRLWATTDLAMFAAQLLTEHADDADTRQALSGIGSILEGDEPQPYFRR
jgi:spectinomycin phosphotransferase